MPTSEERAGIFVARRTLKTALKNGTLIGGVELGSGESHYIQYSPKQGTISVNINGELILAVNHIEFGKPCGVLIIHSCGEISRYDYYPEELESFSMEQ